MGTTEPDMSSAAVSTLLRLCKWQPVFPVHLNRNANQNETNRNDRNETA